MKIVYIPACFEFRNLQRMYAYRTNGTSFSMLFCQRFERRQRAITRLFY